MADEIKRRDFLKLVGLGSTTGVLAGCTDSVQQILPHLVKEEGITPGISTYFATVCRECPAGCGMVVRTREGRALKAEGNPDHPVNQGKLCMRGQASMQGLYNPDRLRQPARVENGQYTPLGWNAALAELTERVQAARDADRPNNVAFVGPLATGTFDSLVDEFLTAAGSEARYVYEPLSYSGLRRAAEEVFGINAIPRHDLSQADAIVSFGAEFLETWVSPVEYATQFGKMHAYDADRVGYYYHVGPRLSLTAANADKWVSVKPGHELTVALGVLNVLVNENLAENDIGDAAQLVAEYSPNRVAADTGIDAELLGKMARRLANGPSAALAGTNLPDGEALARVVNLINYAAGNVGTTVQFGPNQTQGRAEADLTELIGRMNAGEIDVLVLDDVNPAFSLPSTAGWAEAVANVPYVALLSSYPSETALQATVVLSTHTAYEQWNDYVPREGVHGLQQPVMRPLFDTQHPGDILLSVIRGIDAEQVEAENYQTYLQNAWRELHERAGNGGSFRQFWHDALERGGLFEDIETVDVTLAGDISDLTPTAPAIDGPTFFAYPTIQYYDGRLANRPWMQETPDVMTKLTWQSWVEVSPNTAKELGVSNAQVVELETDMGTVKAPVYVFRGIRDGVIAMPIGQGHSEASGRYAGDSSSFRGELIPKRGVRGANPLAVLPATSFAGAVRISATRQVEDLLMTQGSDVQHGRPILQTIPASQIPQYVERKLADTQALLELPPRDWPAGTIPNRVAGQLGEHPGHSVYTEVPHPEHRWGMVINLQDCIGCAACTVACYAENNVPIVGPELVGKSREMAWLWIERYYEEDTDEVRAHFLPMLCQQCTSAPCESVCPVYATYHSPEGLNTQIYNRCVGTRYCANNCPYKVRRFNWFDYMWPDPLNLQLNPDVSVRTKGIMEKCTFCVQRIHETRDVVRRDGRPLQDGDITPACVQTCPTDAITFGDLKDPTSEVAQLTGNWRADDGGTSLPRPVENSLGYQILPELNTQTAVTYLRRVVQDEES